MVNRRTTGHNEVNGPSQAHDARRLFEQGIVGPSSSELAMAYSVDVVELDPAVRQHKRFMKKNSEQGTRKPCLYVGLTGLTTNSVLPTTAGVTREILFLKRYAVGLMPVLYDNRNPMKWGQAQAMEVEWRRSYAPRV